MNKPLPELPANRTHRGLKHVQPAASWPTLSTDAQAHLHAFILYALEEVKDSVPEEEAEEWATAIEHALAELGERIALGGWLVGLRRTRMRRMQERAERASARRHSTETVVVRKEEGSSLKGKGAPPQGSHDEQGYFTLSRHNGKGTVQFPMPPEPSIRELVQSLRPFIAAGTTPSPKPTAKHLLLTVAAPGTMPSPIEQHDADDYEFPRSQFGCIFSPGIFTVPENDDVEEDERGTILYGLDSWDPRPWTGDTPLVIVGGTFIFRGVVSKPEYAALTKVLRLSVFSYLSALLEQCVLTDSHVPLHFPKPNLLSGGSPREAGGAITRALSTGHVSKHKPRDSASSLWAFFSRKKDNLLHRAVPVRRGSLELPLPLAVKHTRSRSRSPAPRSSEDSGLLPRSRRFSFIADYTPAFMQQSPREPEPVQKPYTAALRRIEKCLGILSTSADVTFEPPSLLVRLAFLEKKNPDVRLGGDEKAALTSLLGWEGKHAHGAGMADLTGFVRQQTFSVLYSEYIPHNSTPASSRPSTPNSSQASTSSLSITTPARTILCGRRRRWVTYRYYSRDGNADETLGEAVVRLCSKAEEACDEPGCQFKKGEHELRYTHGGLRILFNVGKAPPREHELEGDEDLPEMWESCVVCGKQSPRVRMQDGTYLLSFAKFLELLIYSANLCCVTPPLCSHTTPPSRPWSSADSPLPRSRLNIARHFAVKDRMVSLSLAPVEDIYEVRVPRLQLQRVKKEELEHTREAQQAKDADRRKLRREIMQFWQTLAEQMDTLEGEFLSDRTPSYHKLLPRLPSADDAYNGFDEDGLITPKGHPTKLPALPPNTPSTPRSASSQWDYPFPHVATVSEQSRSSTVATSNPPSTPPPSSVSAPSTPSTVSTPSAISSASSEPDSLVSLTNLRHKFQRTEQNLYAELSRCPDSNLNDVRRSFVSAARGAAKRLSAWETKHTASHSVDDVVAQHEPEWWQHGCHAVPGGNVIVREDDWGSIIAFTLSSSDYHRELANMSLNRQTPVPPVPPPTPDVSRPSFFSRTQSAAHVQRWFGPSSPGPDPDQDEEGWHEPETYSAVISRKEHPRDPTSILKLGLPDVLRQKPMDSSAIPGLKAVSPGGSNITLGAPPSAWAKPDVQISMQAADGKVCAGSTERVDKVLHELEAATESSGTVRSSSSERTPVSSAFVETHIRRGKASSVMSSDSDITVGEHSATGSISAPPALPPKESPPVPPKTPAGSSTPPSTPPTQSIMTATFTNTLSSALKYVMRSTSPTPTPSKHHHALLSANGASPAIDERPHIKYDWTIGKRLKFSCTVYYAKQFDALRKRCGIDDTFLHSLSRSKNWLAEGGKSRSNFWKTTDNQFIIKTLVNAWNVADLHVLIELAPAYFRYMDATANRPTVLAKLLGFYTVEIKNLETGTTQAKADLLVMENLFFQQDIVKTFDLKGIQGRKVKAASSGSGSKTLFDGDWIEGQQRALTLVQPYSKVVLQEAVKADCEFLAKSNIMDYSLLVGIDESRKQIACGLVDTIGSYTFAKTLEYKAKQGLHSGKEVTVIPPNEYQERFVNAMDHYFVACPDKWSRPQDDTKIPSDYKQLPSVL